MMVSKSEASCSSIGTGKKASKGQLEMITFFSSLNEKRVGLKVVTSPVGGTQLPSFWKHSITLDKYALELAADDVKFK